jgi:hypothetical protein
VLSNVRTTREFPLCRSQRLHSSGSPRDTSRTIAEPCLILSGVLWKPLITRPDEPVNTTEEIILLGENFIERRIILFPHNSRTLIACERELTDADTIVPGLLDAPLEQALANAFREHPKSLFLETGGNLPPANPSNINVNEARLGVIADAVAMEGGRSIAQLRCGDTQHSDVNGLPLHVQAVRCDALRGAPEKIVAPGRAVTTNDID